MRQNNKNQYILWQPWVAMENVPFVHNKTSTRTVVKLAAVQSIRARRNAYITTGKSITRKLTDYEKLTKAYYS